MAQSSYGTDLGAGVASAKNNVYPYELCTDYHASEATLPGLQDATGTKADVDKPLSHPLLVCMSPLTLGNGMATRSPSGPGQPRREGSAAGALGTD